MNLSKEEIKKWKKVGILGEKENSILAYVFNTVDSNGFESNWKDVGITDWLYSEDLDELKFSINVYSENDEESYERKWFIVPVKIVQVGDPIPYKPGDYERPEVINGRFVEMTI